MSLTTFVCAQQTSEILRFSRAYPVRMTFSEHFPTDSFSPTGLHFAKVDGVKAYSDSNVFDEERVFEFTDDNGKTQYVKNLWSSVSLGKATNRSEILFTSSVSMTQKAGMPITRQMMLLINIFSAAVFLAIGFAQPFGISNPSPQLIISQFQMLFVAGNTNMPLMTTQFWYLDKTNMEIGWHICSTPTLSRRSKYFTCVHGAFHEPLKLVRLMRSLEYKGAVDMPLIRFWKDLQDEFGEEWHKLPSVFSFFLPEFQPSGTYEYLQHWVALVFVNRPS